MSYFYSHIKEATGLLQDYHGQEPFASYLKKFFSANRKFGSRDRKQVSQLCYGYFRLGQLQKDWPVEERIALGQYLAGTKSNAFLESFRPEWNSLIHLSPLEKAAQLNLEPLQRIFAFTDDLSEGLERMPFAISHLTQPDLFIRIRPGRRENVLQKLQTAGLSYQETIPGCISLPNTTPVNSLFPPDVDIVVQDESSQRVGEFLLRSEALQRSSPLAWDCCAASGGKSLLLHDLYPNVQLTVSDIRESIIANLKRRFAAAGITRYRSFIKDLGTSPADEKDRYDLLIADVPCSGSGTWGRTPENLVYFDAGRITEYAALQKEIVANALPSLKEGGEIIYITCSVFRKENEENVDGLCRELPLQLVMKETIVGYPRRADTMFAAILKKL